MKITHPLVVFSFAGLLTLSTVSAAALSAFQNFQQTDRIARGINAGGTDLSGLSKTEAIETIKRTAKNKLNKNAVLLSYQKQAWSIAPNEIDLQVYPEKTVADAIAICRSGNLQQDLTDAFNCLVQKKSLPLASSCNEKKLKQLLDKIAKKIDRPGSNASCSITANGTILKQQAVVGKKTDTAALTAHLLPSLLELRLPRRIEIEPDTEEPDISDKDIKDIDRILAQYTTYFDSSSARGENIRLASTPINHFLLKPEQSFSFNKTVGERSAAAGYLDAPVIIDRRTVPGIGGGVCQVSSTLYNAILLAGLKPTARSSHFFPAAYVPAGLDATVDYGNLDLCFKNTLKHNVYFLTTATDDELTVYVLGTSADLNGQDISVDSFYNDDGHAESWRIYSQHGKEIHREHLFTDEYEEPLPPPEEENHHEIKRNITRKLRP